MTPTDGEPSRHEIEPTDRVGAAGRGSGRSVGGFAGFAAAMATLTGRPASFAVACVVVVVWAISGPFFHFSDTWQLVINTGTTIVTFLMVFVIQNAQNRDGLAIQVKLDELIRATHDARNALVGIEHLDDRRVAEIEQDLERRAASER